MAVPVTSGKLCTHLGEMEIGDYIPCRYSVSAQYTAGVFSEIGAEVTAELPTTPAIAPNGQFYFIKATNTLLLADRTIQARVAYNALDAAGYVAGLKYTSTSRIRLPSQAEWTEIITNSDLGGKITKQAANVWHGTQMSTNFTCAAYGEWTIYTELVSDTSGSSVRTVLNRSGSHYSANHHFRTCISSGKYTDVPIYYGKDKDYQTTYPGGGYNGWTCYMSFRPALELTGKALYLKGDKSVYGMKEG